MSDIVERLRKWSVFGYGYEASCDMKEAATSIEEQRANMANAARLLSEQTAEIERLRAALHDLADEYANPFNESEGPAYRNARAALTQKEGGE
jgi:hypothetical protein